MKRQWALRTGFTIIELLVVMVVIGILITIMVISYSGIQQRARDSERTSDITQIKVALDKYHADSSQYPNVCGGSGDDVPCSVGNLQTALRPYLETIPHDPTNVLDGPSDYQYARRATTDDGYGLLVHYEARAMCKTGTNTHVNYWGAGTPFC